MKITIEDGEVVIRIAIPEDPSQSRVSKSGNNHVLDTTHGFTPVPGTEMKVAVNLIAPASKRSMESPQKPVQVITLPRHEGRRPLRELLKRRDVVK